MSGSASVETAADFGEQPGGEAARWLADALEHIAVLQEQQLHRHVLLRLDETEQTPSPTPHPSPPLLQYSITTPTTRHCTVHTTTARNC